MKRTKTVLTPFGFVRVVDVSGGGVDMLGLDMTDFDQDYLILEDPERKPGSMYDHATTEVISDTVLDIMPVAGSA